MQVIKHCNGESLSNRAAFTVNHPASSYGQPVLVWAGSKEVLDRPACLVLTGAGYEFIPDSPKERMLFAKMLCL